MSNSEYSSQASGGLGLSGVLFVVFLVLKLLGVIDWSWWWITAPLWIPLVLVWAALSAFFIIVITVGYLE